MIIRELRSEDINEWHRMRIALWPESTPQELWEEMKIILAGGGFDEEQSAWSVFVAERPNGPLGGMIEVSLRRVSSDPNAKPLGFLEGWWVDPDLRRTGVGGQLVQAAEQWAVAQGCTEMGSDTNDYREVSIAAHQRLGYTIVSRGEEIDFRKQLNLAGRN